MDVSLTKTQELNGNQNIIFINIFFRIVANFGVQDLGIQYIPILQNHNGLQKCQNMLHSFLLCIVQFIFYVGGNLWLWALGSSPVP